LLDENIQKRILQFLYDKWVENFVQYTDIEDTTFEGVSKESIVANAEYLASKRLIEEARTVRFTTRITAYGVDHVENVRISPDVKKRIRILQILKGHFEKEPYGFVSREELVKQSGFSQEDIMRNIWYLGEEGLARVEWALGGYFSARITDIGIDLLRRPSLLENEQRVMSYAYSIFFLLENQLRIFIERKLAEAYPDQTWEKTIPQEILAKAQDRKSKESDSGLSPFFYMDFRHLRIIITKNWNIFEHVFRNPIGIVSRLDELEPIRRKIAHCRLLSMDELKKLELFLNEISKMLIEESGA